MCVQGILPRLQTKCGKPKLATARPAIRQATPSTQTYSNPLQFALLPQRSCIPSRVDARLFNVLSSMLASQAHPPERSLPKNRCALLRDMHQPSEFFAKPDCSLPDRRADSMPLKICNQPCVPNPDVRRPAPRAHNVKPTRLAAFRSLQSAAQRKTPSKCIHPSFVTLDLAFNVQTEGGVGLWAALE